MIRSTLIALAVVGVLGADDQQVRLDNAVRAVQETKTQVEQADQQIKKTEEQDAQALKEILDQHLTPEAVKERLAKDVASGRIDQAAADRRYAQARSLQAAQALAQRAAGGIDIAGKPSLACLLAITGSTQAASDEGVVELGRICFDGDRVRAGLPPVHSRVGPFGIEEIVPDGNADPVDAGGGGAVAGYQKAADELERLKSARASSQLDRVLAGLPEVPAPPRDVDARQAELENRVRELSATQSRLEGQRPSLAQRTAEADERYKNRLQRWTSAVDAWGALPATVDAQRMAQFSSQHPEVGYTSSTRQNGNTIITNYSLQTIDGESLPQWEADLQAQRSADEEARSAESACDSQLAEARSGLAGARVELAEIASHRTQVERAIASLEQAAKAAAAELARLDGLKRAHAALNQRIVDLAKGLSR